MRPKTLILKYCHSFEIVVRNLADQRKSEAPELADIRNELAQTIQQQAIQARIDELTQKAQIERPALEGAGPEIMRQLDLIQE